MEQPLAAPDQAMSVQYPDILSGNDASADALEEVFRKKYLDIDALTRAFADHVISGKRSYEERFYCRAAPHHSRARYTDRRGRENWIDVRFDIFEVTREVRALVDAARPMTGPHPHNWSETWRDDGKCIVKNCHVWRDQPERRETPR